MKRILLHLLCDAQSYPLGAGHRIQGSKDLYAYGVFEYKA
jgi:hypothetical protein